MPPAAATSGMRRGRPVDAESDDDGDGNSEGTKKPSLLRNIASGVFAILVIMGVVGRYVIRPMRAFQRAQANLQQPAQPPTVAPAPNVLPVAAPSPVATASPAATPSPVAQPTRVPWRMPELPDPGAGVRLEPGVMLHEVQLPGSGGGTTPPMPGHAGKLWLYLPEGNRPENSLPCILIAGAGTKLIHGMALGNGDRPEHLPYVRAGFAVLAYELDGSLPDPEPTNDAAFAPYIREFVDAEAGLVNLRVAIEFATTRVPEIDPERLFAAGHSSAATLALLAAENEPRIAACVAFAPVVDISQAIPPAGQQAVGRLVPGADQLFTRFNPREGESNLDCPLFLFMAQDDPNAGPIRDFVTRLRSMGKSVTLATVAQGGHYQPMIQNGIPAAIRWLQSLRRGPDGSLTAPAQGMPATAPRIGPRRPLRVPSTPPPNIRRPRMTPRPR
jgi:dienelactone hydrolase